MRYYKYIFITLFAFGVFSSCNKRILDEVPKDFFSPENAFVTKGDFESGLAHIYLLIRNQMYSFGANGRNGFLGNDADIMYSTTNVNPYMTLMRWNGMNPDNAEVRKWWNYYYEWIGRTNVIITRAESDRVEWTNEEEKNSIVAEAKFIRAFAYRFLANMWGGVPLVLEETTAPKFDYVRATQEEVYRQCKEDLEFAVQWMKTIDQLPGGRAPRAAAYHLLAEINIGLEEYDDAIDAASAVIDDPKFHLMTERFGKWTNFRFRGYDYQGPAELWGDVYWDLFQEGNMNWQEGNREAIWNVQFEYMALGGHGNFQLECIGPGWWALPDRNNIRNNQKDTLCGRPNDAASLTDYVINEIWQYKGDWNRDMRNSEYNFQRTYYWVNPNSAFYGQPITRDNISPLVSFETGTKPHLAKTTGTIHYGEGLTDIGEKHDFGRIYKDWYIMRLPETYFLRAEAYMRKERMDLAADDINVVRSRAKATLVTPGDVNIELIIDERARELSVEEFRYNTLMRLGKLSEHLMKYNPGVISAGIVMNDYHNKFPIPNAEIEANRGAVLEQNFGY